MSKTSKRSLVAAAAVAAIGAGLVGCASTTPTREISQGYAIFDVKGEIAPAKAAEAIKVALQKNMTGVQISNGLPPSPLPDKPARFQLVSPFKAGSGIAALAASSGQAIKVPTCEGAILTANGRDSSYAKYGEATTFFACLMPYKGGYGLNVFTTYSKASGGFNAAILGATLARTVTGDSAQFIPRTLGGILDALKAAGATVDLQEAYP